MTGFGGHGRKMRRALLLSTSCRAYARQEVASGNPTGYFVGAPDLAVEIRSPDNTMAELFSKAAEYAEAGCGLSWIVEPKD